MRSNTPRARSGTRGWEPRDRRRNGWWPWARNRTAHHLAPGPETPRGSNRVAALAWPRARWWAVTVPSPTATQPFRRRSRRLPSLVSGSGSRSTFDISWRITSSSRALCWRRWRSRAEDLICGALRSENARRGNRRASGMPPRNERPLRGGSSEAVRCSSAFRRAPRALGAIPRRARPGPATTTCAPGARCPRSTSRRWSGTGRTSSSSRP